MANLSSRLVISLTDRVSGPAKNIATSLKQLRSRATTSSFRVMREEAGRAREHFRSLATTTAAAGVGLYAFMQSTKNFNESKWGYGFARLSDYMKDGKTDWAAWRKDMDATAKSARALATRIGTTADETMKAREEVQKVGLSGPAADSVWKAALGLHMTEPEALASGDAVQFMNAIYNAYAKQREALAKKMGKDANDPGFIDAWIKGIAGKVAVAGAASALGPGSIIEGMRQFAPQWASMGISPEFALAALAHGSNYGFGASELGTSFKSMAAHVIKPTAAGLKALDALGINRAKYTDGVAAYPGKATQQLNSLLGGGLSKRQKAWVERQLKHAQEKGITASPEFQQNLTNRLMKYRGLTTEADRESVRNAVANSVTTTGSNFDLQGFIKELVDKKAGPGALMDIFEGKHYARDTPIFQYYDKLYALFQQLQSVDGSFLDNAMSARKDSEAGTADQVAGAWQELQLKLQDTGAIEKAKGAIIDLSTAIGALPGTVTTAIGGLLLAGLVASPLMALGGLAKAGGRAAVAGARWLGWGGAAEGAAGGAALFSMKNWKAGSAAAKIANQRMILGMTGARGALASDLMIAGMGAAGATAATTTGRSLLARAGALLIPGLGYVMLGASAGTGIYAAYKDYQKTGSVLSAIKAFGWGFLTMGMGGDAQAAEAPNGGAQGQNGPAASDQVIAIARQTADQIRSIFAGVNLSAEGQRLMESLAAGMRAGIPAVQSAASSAQAAAAANALRGAYHDGAR
ncbi:phage tail tape measure protein [Hyphomicrobium sp. MC8b]|uniref:phage tail tape measure protein n=1 Tax=Hyphomicrobium sp. MC8b TaxID=300273 RepID=UPI00391A4EF8